MPSAGWWTRAPGRAWPPASWPISRARRRTRCIGKWRSLRGSLRDHVLREALAEAGEEAEPRVEGELAAAGRRRDQLDDPPRQEQVDDAAEDAADHRAH